MSHGLAEPLSLTGIGGVTPVGDTIRGSCAAIRAGVSAFAEYPLYTAERRDPRWEQLEPISAALVPTVTPTSFGAERLVTLASRALQNLVDDSKLRRKEITSSALVVVLPDGVGADLAAPLQRRSGLSFASAEAIAGGATAVFELLPRLPELLSAHPRVIVVAVDSHHDVARLATLDDARRLRSARNRDGFVPGEAAVALLIEARPARPVRLRIEQVGFGDEARPLTGDRSSSARGLQQALAGVMGEVETPFPWVLCDLNGESYRHFEWGTVQARLGARLPVTRHLVHPAECVGSIGAASGALLLACAAQAFERGYAPHPHALLWAARSTGMRAAVRVSAAAPTS